MAQTEYDASPLELKKFAMVQIALPALFSAAIFFMLGGMSEDFPPLWLAGALLVPIVVAAWYSERVWMQGQPLNPHDDLAAQREQGVAVFAAQTVRKLIYCEIPIMIGVIAGFFLTYGGWPVLITAPPALAVLAFEVWPSLRNAAMTEVMLNSRGAKSDVLESFIIGDI